MSAEPGRRGAGAVTGSSSMVGGALAVERRGGLEGVTIPDTSPTLWSRSRSWGSGSVRRRRVASAIVASARERVTESRLGVKCDFGGCGGGHASVWGGACWGARAREGGGCRERRTRGGTGWCWRAACRPWYVCAPHAARACATRPRSGPPCAARSWRGARARRATSAGSARSPARGRGEVGRTGAEARPRP